MVISEVKKKHVLLFLIPLGIFTGCLILSKYIITNYFIKSTLLIHNVLEVTCLVIPFMIFSVIWFTYKQNTVEMHMLSFGFLLIFIFQLFHLLTFSTAHDYFLWYFIFARILEASVLLLIFIPSMQHIKIKKKTGTIITIIFGIVVSSLVYLSRQYLPALYNINSLFSLRLMIEILIILLVFVCLYFIYTKFHHGLFSYSFIYPAIAIMALTSLSFILMWDAPTSYFNILAHLLRVATYILLFIGIFGRAVIYPYERLDQILNHLPLAVATYDSNYRLNFSNRRAEEITGACFQECLGLSDRDIMKKLNSSGEQTICGLLSPGKDTLHNEIRTILNNENKSTKIFIDAYRLQSGGYLIVFDEAQKIQALDNMQLQTQTILNAINSNLLILDNNKRIIMCNKALAEDVGMEIKDLVGLDIKEFSQKFSVSESRGTFNLQEPFEISYQTIDGKQKDLLLTMALIKNVDEEIIGSIAVGTNSTDINKEKGEKQQQDKLALLGQMASGIVHEIRNPLTTILGFSNLIKSKPQSEKNAEFAAYIEEEVKDLNRIVSDFLSFARPRTPILEEVSLNQLISSAKVLFESHLLSNQIAVSYYHTEDDIIVNVDENQIKQVILNIINNAVDVLCDGENGEIKIFTGYSELNEAYISIHNNGPALTDEERRKIGTPFFTTKSKGTGLGFSVCQQILQEHGGRINIRSEEDYGTAFELCFTATNETFQL